MIVIRMSGGLGNQMFQYALYVKLRSMGREVCFDDRTQYDEEAFKNSAQKRRPKRLDVFGIDYPTVLEEELTRITDSAMDPVSRLRRKLSGRKTMEKDDEDFVFDPSFLETEEGYFCGNFQSPRYFEGAEEEVRKAFTFPPDILTPPENAEKSKKRLYEKAAVHAQRIHAANATFDERRQAGAGDGGAAASPAGEGDTPDAAMEERTQSRGTAGSASCFAGGSTSIHLRFGDYLDKQEIYGGICTDAYYDAAVEKLAELDPQMTFFVFSNDRERAGEWVRRQAEKEKNRGRSRFVLVTGSDEDHGYLDLYLMSLCRNHIIANSSFSWWGAWLCANPGKITFAPSIWNNRSDGSELTRTDIYDRGMRRINPQGHEITEEPLISVIMAAYNVAPFVRRAVRSVCGQTYRNLELIAVDDGSTDGTGVILDECAAQDPRIRVIHRANGGLPVARNDGIRISKGDYIGFVDGDDAAHPEMYEALVRAVLESGADIGAVNYREVYADEQIPQEGELRDAGNHPSGAGAGRLMQDEEKCPSGPAGIPDGADCRTMADDMPEGALTPVSEILRNSVVMNRRRALRTVIRSGVVGSYDGVEMHHNVWTKLYARRLLKDNLFVEGSLAEDIYFTTSAMCRSVRVVFIREPLYDYLKNRSGSIMNIGRAKRTLQEEIPAWAAHRRMLREAGEEDLADEAEYYYYRRLLFYIEQYQADPDTAEQAKEIRELLLAQKERVLELTDGADYGRRGDRLRLKLYVTSPGLYILASGLYAKTYVAVRNRRS